MIEEEKEDFEPKTYDDLGTESEDEYVGCKHDFEIMSEYVEVCRFCGKVERK